MTTKTDILIEGMVKSTIPNNKYIKIILNGQILKVEEREYTFKEIIKIVFGRYKESFKSVTMTSTMPNGNDSHIYSLNDKIRMKEGIRINADITNGA